MLPELLKFGVVGGIGSVIDIGGTAVLHSEYHVGPLLAKAVAVTIASVVTYLGSRFWTFRHRESQSGHREVVLFIVLNVIGLVIAEAVIGFVVYVMGMHGKVEYNAASLIGTGLGTIFRFYTYRKFVFKAPAQAPAAQPLPNVPAFPDYPPWELDPSFFAAAAAPAAATAPVPVAVTAPLLAAPTMADAAPAPAGHVKTVNSWDTAPIGVWGPAAAAARGESPAGTEAVEQPATAWDQPAAPVRVATPHRHSQPVTGQEERRHVPTGPIALPPPARPSGRHRRP